MDKKALFWGGSAAIVGVILIITVIFYYLGFILYLVGLSVFVKGIISKGTKNKIKTSKQYNLLQLIAGIVIWFLLLEITWNLFITPFEAIGHTNPLGTSCIANAGYICNNSQLHDSTFTVVLGQLTGATWTSANFIWVPYGISAPSVDFSCPIPATNSITSGLSCATPRPINLKSGQTTLENFTFNQTTPAGSIRSGTIWVIFQSSGTWHESQIGTATLKSV